MRYRSVIVGLICWGMGLFATGGAAETPVSFEGYKVVRIEPLSQADVDAVEASGANILNCTHGVGPMDVLVSPDQLATLRRRPMPIATLDEDVPARLEQLRSMAGVAGSGDPFDDFFLDFRPYGSAVTEIGTMRWYMNELIVRYPALASQVSLGTTVEGRTIYGLRVSASVAGAKPGVLYFGAEHAREWLTTAVPLYLAAHLLENYGTDPTVTDLVDNVEFFLVPVFNVDGYLYTWSNNRFWRKNRKHISGSTYGVDLNRNWDEGWGGPGSSGSAGSETYRGPSAFSEMETQSMRDFFYAHPNIRAQVDIHSFSELILWPWGYTAALPADQAVFEDVGYGMRDAIFDVHGEVYTAGPTHDTIYPASGVSVDWTYAELGLLSLAFELRPSQFVCGGLDCFAPPPTEIVPTCEEIVAALLLLTDSPYVRSYPGPDALSHGERYLQIDPNYGAGKFALRLTSPDYPCLDKFVTPTGNLADTPEYHVAPEWASVVFAAAEIVPGTEYVIQAEYVGGGVSSMVSVTTRLFGDVIDPPDVISFLDISAVVDRYQGNPTALPVERCDLAPEVPDGLVDFLDVAASVDGFRGIEYPFFTPDCP